MQAGTQGPEEAAIEVPRLIPITRETRLVGCFFFHCIKFASYVVKKGSNLVTS